MSDIRENILRLVRLQELERSIVGVDVDLAKLPVEKAGIDATLFGARSAVAASKDRIQDGTRKRRELEGEVASLKVRIARHQDQMLAVKTNEEYRALTREIAGETEKITKCEDSILSFMELVENGERELKLHEAQLKVEEKRVVAESVVLEARAAELAAERGGYEKERDVVSATVSRPAMELYRRIAKLRGGLAMSSLEGGTCGECRVRVRPQAAMEAREFINIIQCDSCSRVLYAKPPASDADVESTTP